MKAYSIFLLLIVSLLFMQCAKSGGEEVLADKSQERAVSEMDSQSNENDLLSSPDWAKDATIYEVNLRQYTEEGTFKSFLPHIPRLKDMGVDILLFMPIYPIDHSYASELGNNFAVQDYTAVNEKEHGTLAEFKEVVTEIHRSDMKIILEFMPNYTGWDHAWITEHPEYYARDSEYKIVKFFRENRKRPLNGADLAELDFDKMELRKAMTAEIKWWLTEHDIDGFKFDFAYEAPNEFWDTCIKELMQTKKVFLLADTEKPYLRNKAGFSADYGMSLYYIMDDIAQGKGNAGDIINWYKESRRNYQKGYHVLYTSNNDKNKWRGTEFDRFELGHKAFAILCGTLEGMPLVYSGQEEPLRKRLKNLKKDPIGFKNYAYADFYRTLLNLKKKNQALWNGQAGGEATFWNTNNEDVIAYSREKNGNIIFVVINLCSKQQTVDLSTVGLEGAYNNVFSSSTTSLSSKSKFNLQPWDYLVLSKLER